MFSLILMLLAQLFVVVLLVAGVYYGGQAFVENQAKAKAAQRIASATQIVGAIQVYMNDKAGAPPNTIETLVLDGYLKQEPDGAWYLYDDYLVGRVESSQVCDQINKVTTGGETLRCTDPTLPADVTVCCIP